MDALPLVSIIIPCREEKDSIAACLDSVTANDYPRERLEVLVVDGMSVDGTREIVGEYARKYPFIRMLDNPRKEQPIALNIGISASSGELVMRMDAHSRYQPDYIGECVRAIREYGADNVGGRWIIVPRDNSLIGKAICLAASVSFGVGNAYYRLIDPDKGDPLLTRPRWGINVAYFCCRREVFRTVGMFNDNLYRSEDIDFRARLDRAGYRTLFVPSVVCYYSMRTNYWSFVRHMFRNGVWVFLPLCFAQGISFSLRHIVPLFFVLGMAVCGLAAFYFPSAAVLFVLLAGLYLGLSLFYACRLARRHSDLRLLWALPFIFFTLHMAYGTGSLAGLVKVITCRRYGRDKGSCRG